MNPRKPTLIAFVLALLGAGALHFYLRRYELEIAGGTPTAVVVATRDLALGDVIARAALDVRELPERYVEERHVLADDLDRIVGARATASVGGGSTLLWSDLDVSQEGRTLSGLVRTGMRAFTLPERDVSFDGLLRAGDRVDVVFTPGSGASLGTVTLLQSALVLTVGGKLGDDTRAEDESERFGRVTLSVTAEQAQLLAHSERRGALRLALRNPQDLVLAEGIAPSMDLDLAEPRRDKSVRSEL